MLDDGFFVDWNGDTRRVGLPGDGYSCRLIDHGTYLAVEVSDAAGFACHEATFFPSLADVEAAGVTVNLV